MINNLAVPSLGPLPREATQLYFDPEIKSGLTNSQYKKCLSEFTTLNIKTYSKDGSWIHAPILVRIDTKVGAYRKLSLWFVGRQTAANRSNFRILSSLE